MANLNPTKFGSIVALLARVLTSVFDGLEVAGVPVEFFEASPEVGTRGGNGRGRMLGPVGDLHCQYCDIGIVVKKRVPLVAAPQWSATRVLARLAPRA